jgi:methanethiol oxidase
VGSLASARPGLRSSRIHILDTKPDPKRPTIIKVIEPEEVAEKASYTRPHTVHCGPEGIYVAALGNREGKGPGGVFLMDHETFDVRGQWEVDRGPQHFAYDAWWHLGHDTLVTSEWGTPDTFANGLIPEVLLGAKYGRRLRRFRACSKSVRSLGGKRTCAARRSTKV